MKIFRTIDPISLFIIFSFAIFDCATWWTIFMSTMNEPVRIYFLGVTTGSSELVVLPGDIKLLIDAGPDQKIIDALAKIMPENDRRIDLAIVTTPLVNHFGGYTNILEQYRLGAFLYNGRKPLSYGDETSWQQLTQKIRDLHIPIVTLGAGDKIIYGASAAAVLSPDSAFSHSASLNDASIVLYLKTENLGVLFAASAGANVEKMIFSRYGNIRVDVLQGDTSFKEFDPITATSSKAGVVTELWQTEDSSKKQALHTRVIR